MSLPLNQVNIDKYVTVISTNNLYNQYKKRYQFYLESYMGGEEYKQAGHLVRYQMETEKEYQQRLDSTPVDNHCKSVISTYISFLFREEPEREFGSMANEPQLEDFLEDADLEGRSLDAVMKDAAIWANVFGHSWIIVSKPNVGAVTMADEIAIGVRPYVNVISALIVTDWRWERAVTGRYQLSYFKYIEEVNDTITTYKEWTRETVTTYTVDNDQKTVVEEIVEVNGLGVIPAIQVYAGRSPIRGIGISSISDIADFQKAIFNEYSEIEQLVRLQNHPALVKTADVEAAAGAGAIIQMPDNLDPGLRPYLLEPSANGLSAIYASIAARVDAIDKMANTGSIRATESRRMSAVAQKQEFELLNAKLSELADSLELAEESIWQFYAMYQGRSWDGEIEYPGSFNISDEISEFDKLVKAKQAATNPKVFNIIDGRIVELLGEEEDIIFAEEMAGAGLNLPARPVFEPHEMYNPETGDEVIARTEQEHLDYGAQGYIHKEEY